MALLFAAVATQAANYTNVASGFWSDDATWSGTGTPGSNDLAAIYNTSSRTITVDVTRTISALTIGGSSSGWNLYDNGSGNALTMSTLNISTWGTLRNGLTLNVTSNGFWSGLDGNANFLNGTINILSGATFDLPVRLEGTGTFSVQSGGTVTLSGNYINYNQGPNLTFNLDGTANFTQSSTLYHNAKLFTGGGTWNINSNGTLRFEGGAGSSFALNPATALWTGNSGTVLFNVSGATNVLGAFSMGGSNNVTFFTGYNQINRASIFQNLDISGTATLDLNPADASVVTQTVNGTLSAPGNNVQILKSSSGAGAVVNVAGLAVSTGNHFDIATNVTVNLSGPGSMGGSGFMQIIGAFNIQNGGTFSHSAGRLANWGTITIDPGGTFIANGGFAMNYYANSLDGWLTLTNNGTVKISSGYNFFPKTVAGTGYFYVTNAYANMTSAGTVEGWSGGGAFNSRATWHVAGTNASIDFPGGSANGITSIGTNATVILEDGGKIVEFNNSARNALTVYGKLSVRGTSTLQFNSGQTLMIAGGGLLSGNGTIAGNTTVQGGGAVAPGASLGTLTFSNNFTLAGTAQMELGSGGNLGSSDKINVLGTLTGGGVVQVTTNGTFVIALGDKWDLFDWTSGTPSFTFDGSAVVLDPSLAWDTSQLNIDGTIAVVIPEPSAWALVILGLAGLLIVRRIR